MPKNLEPVLDRFLECRRHFVNFIVYKTLKAFYGRLFKSSRAKWTGSRSSAAKRFVRFSFLIPSCGRLSMPGGGVASRQLSLSRVEQRMVLNTEPRPATWAASRQLVLLIDFKRECRGRCSSPFPIQAERWLALSVLRPLESLPANGALSQMPMVR